MAVAARRRRVTIGNASGPNRRLNRRAAWLTVGLVANVFTAVFVSRTLFELVLSRRQVAKLSI